ncbi:hypothetical protein CLNEO_06760 [Anaerotignum neopropionicum]|uniref:Uncharacterized protein n=1 Tax=Anaerotignum neopropionicum TaxID=36847 RepID=A0A136WJC6_9FIRM|nr:hypothetical protein [Anaerotignum neopropionicum]KXL54565.1 hypothetical protein CLNEO_06760 [Anaerotignum neopropionicum]
MNTVFTGILLNLQKKYNKVNEFQDITKQMAASLQRNDLYSFQLLMNMRTELMIDIENMDYAEEELIKSLSEDDEKQIRSALSKEMEGKQFATPDLQRINDIYNKTKRSLQNTVQVDKAISLKVGGENSFYHN